jgi:tetratricopeptide (TPR) repeat protein
LTTSPQLIARRILEAPSSGAIAAILVSSPEIDASSLLSILRHPEAHGFSPQECTRLKTDADPVALVFRALDGELSPDIPAHVYGQIGMAYRLQGEARRARDFYRYAFHNAETPVEKAAGLCSLGLLELEADNFDTAQTIWTRARKFAEQCNEPSHVLVDIVNNLGLVAREKHEWAQAFARFEEAADLARCLRFAPAFIRAQLNLAATALDAGCRERGNAALNSIGEALQSASAHEEELYYELRRKLEASEPEAGKDARIPADLSVLLQKAPVDTVLLRSRLSAAPGSLKTLIEAILVPCGPLAQIAPGDRVEVLKALHSAAKDRSNAVALALVALELYEIGEQRPTERIAYLEEALNAHYPLSVRPDIGVRLHDALGHAYFNRREEHRAADVRAAIRHWHWIVQFLESGRIAGTKVLEIIGANTATLALATTHWRLGSAFNELMLLEGLDDREEGVRHFEAALKHLPADSPAKLYASVMNDFGNALGYLSERSHSRITLGQRDSKAFCVHSIFTRACSTEAAPIPPSVSLHC